MSHRHRRARKIFWATLVLSSTSCIEPGALANGRFPRAQRLVQSATDANVLALFGTYGLIVSSDAGQSWNHVCEAATGTYKGEDPLLEILPDQRLVARTDTALVRSGSSWCNWSTIRDGSVNGVQDITRPSSDPLSIYALIGSYVQGKGFSSELVQSADGGTTWSAAKSLPLVARGLTLDVAPSSPKRVVVSGLDSAGNGRLLVSDDGGGTWLGRTVTGTDPNSAPFIAAISKNDPNRIFVRTDSYQDINGIDTADDALLLSLDAGTTWTTVIQRHAKLFGFALSPDESTLLVGYGDPVVAATYVDPADVGIYRADMASLVSALPDASTQFQKIFDASTTCLRWTASGLFACTSQEARGFEVGRAANADFTLADANPFTPLLRLSDVRPLPCSAGTNGYACYSDPTNGFASVCQIFRASCDASAPPPTAGNPDSGLDASAAGANANGGGGGKAGQGGAPPSGATGQGASATQNGSSCACRSASSGRSNGAGAFFALCVGTAVRRRNRRLWRMR